MNFLNITYDDLEKLAIEKRRIYEAGNPFPHIVIDNIFNKKILNDIVNDFPKNLDKIGNKFNNKVEKKAFTQ